MRVSIYIQGDICSAANHKVGVRPSNRSVLGVDGRYAVVRPARKTVSYLDSMSAVRKFASPPGIQSGIYIEGKRTDADKVSPPGERKFPTGSSGPLAGPRVWRWNEHRWSVVG